MMMMMMMMIMIDDDNDRWWMDGAWPMIMAADRLLILAGVLWTSNRGRARRGKWKVGARAVGSTLREWAGDWLWEDASVMMMMMMMMMMMIGNL
jgi:hypothetical protein